MRGRYQNSRGGLGLPVPRSEHRGLGATTNSVALPKPKPGAMREHLVVSAIGGREIAQTHRSRIPHREDALQQLDFGNGLFRVHPDQYGAQATARSTPGRNRLAKITTCRFAGLRALRYQTDRSTNYAPLRLDLRPYFDGRSIRHRSPDLIHLLVRYCDTPVSPVAQPVACSDPSETVG